MTKEKVSLDNVQLQKFTEKVSEKVEFAIHCWNLQDYDQAVKTLNEVAEIIEEVGPQFTLVIPELLENYGDSLKPIIDCLIIPGANFAGYFHETAATTKESILPQMEKNMGADAKIHAIKMKTLKEAGFSRREAMDIILAEISGSKGSQKSWKDVIEGFSSKTREERRKREFGGGHL